MEGFYLYQPDTVRSRSLLKAFPEKGSVTNLKVQRNDLKDEHLSVDIIPQTRQVEVLPPSAPTYSQLRYWQWRNEVKLLVDSSRFIKPRNDVRLTPSVALDDKSLILPSYPRQFINTDWITILILIALVIFASVQRTFSKYLTQLYQTVFNKSVASRMYREKNNAALQGAFRLEISFYIVSSIFLFQVFDFFQLKQEYEQSLRFAISAGVILVYYLLKKGAYNLLSFIVEGYKETSEYLFNLDNYNRVLGLILFPITSLIAFYPYGNKGFAIYIGLIFSAIFYMFVLQRGISILTKKQFSKFYLFLYLCTLEFVPLLLFYGIIIV